MKDGKKKQVSKKINEQTEIKWKENLAEYIEYKIN